MNSRIEQLFKQAGGYVENDNGQLLTYTQDLDVEKFAELVVQECAWQVLKDQQVPHQYQILICERFSVLNKTLE